MVDMSEVKKKVDERIEEAKRKEAESPVADFPCEECGEYYICIDEEFAPIGRCINCGTDHEMYKSGKSGQYFPEYQGGEYMGVPLTDDLLEKVEKE